MINPRIVSVRIQKSTSIFNPPVVFVFYETQTVEMELFSYYPDEISFSASELIGLTRSEAISLKGKKDRAFLIS
jgi:hypothetical protein